MSDEIIEVNTNASANTEVNTETNISTVEAPKRRGRSPRIVIEDAPPVVALPAEPEQHKVSAETQAEIELGRQRIAAYKEAEAKRRAMTPPEPVMEPKDDVVKTDPNFVPSFNQSANPA